MPETTMKPETTSEASSTQAGATSTKTETGSTRTQTTGTLSLQKDEGAALVSACLVILLDLLHGEERFPDPARPLFRAYMKLCGISNHKVDLTVLQAAMLTWDRAER